MSLPDSTVVAIRTAGLTDAYWGRRLRVDDKTIREARIGLTYRHVPTPPDTAPREGTGSTYAIRRGLPQRAVLRKARRQWR